MVDHLTYEQLCCQYIKFLYQKVPHNFPQGAVGNFEHSSGEVLPESLSKILSLIKPKPQDRFLDLGSATGKIVSQVFLQTEVCAAVGFEIVPHLVQIAKSKAKILLDEFPSLTYKQIDYREGDFLLLNWDNPTIVYMNNVCFKQATILALVQRIQQYASIHTVVSLRPLALFEKLVFKKAISIECSWDSALCYVYSKR